MPPPPPQQPEELDVLIVGAGLSGVCAASHLGAKHPGRSYAILEARERIGGTWDLFRYPGVRSDSDMYTLGYSFKPWRDGRVIADGPSILAYIEETAEEREIWSHIRLRHRVLRAEWDTADGRWEIEAEHTDTSETVRLRCRFLLMCCGYYDYEAGYTPELPGRERFRGKIVHPQSWSDEIDYEGKQVVVVGSGATAVTLVPAMAERAARVTMLQRSPSYIVSLARTDPVAERLRRSLPDRIVYPLVRWKNALLMLLVFQLSRRRPELVKSMIRKGVVSELPDGYDVEQHFSPHYNPWEQRLCVVPDGDLFAAVRSGRAEIVTDRIAGLTENGLALESGAELAADLIVTATGLQLLVLGGIELTVDGQTVEYPETMTYKGMMLSNVPNMAFTFGYTNASWTLKCDLTCAWACRLLSYMDEHGFDICTPINRDPEMRSEPLIDLSSGYVMRSVDDFPRQGSRAPWRQLQNYVLDILALRLRPIADRALTFSRATAAPQPGRVREPTAVLD